MSAVCSYTKWKKVQKQHKARQEKVTGSTGIVNK